MAIAIEEESNQRAAMAAPPTAAPAITPAEVVGAGVEVARQGAVSHDVFGDNVGEDEVDKDGFEEDKFEED